MSLAEMESLLGKLVWASTGVELGRVYTRQCRRPCVAVSRTLATRQQREAFCIPLYHFGKALDELRWWKGALEARGGAFAWHIGSTGCFERWRWTGKPGESLPGGVLEFATDASRYGGGGVFETERVSRRWLSHELRFHINVLECVMILDMLLQFGNKMSGCRVVAWCDNLVSVCAVNKGVGASEVMNSIIRRVRLLCLEASVALYLCHIPGAQNLDPDALSRGALGKRVCDWSLIPQCMAKWARRFGAFTFDA